MRAKKKTTEAERIMKYGELRGEDYYISAKALGKDPFHDKSILRELEKELRSAGAKKVHLPSDIVSAELWLFFREFIGIFMIWGREFGFRIFTDSRFVRIAKIQCVGLAGSPDKGYCCRGGPMAGSSFTVFRDIKK
jgi:hypothetical protein